MTDFSRKTERKEVWVVRTGTIANPGKVKRFTDKMAALREFRSAEKTKYAELWKEEIITTKTKLI